MAKEKKSEPKIVLEREYIVPLRREWLKVGKHKRATRAVKALKKFIAKHMKIYDRDLRKIKVDIILNNQIRHKGMRKPLSKVKVKAKKYDNDIVRVELVNLPEHIKYSRLREEKLKLKTKKEEKPGQKDSEVKKEESEKKEETKEKIESSKEAELKLAKEEAMTEKHLVKQETTKMQNIAGKRSQRGR
ncbi:MAG: hypothetical protein Q8N99_05835 [Nanoarchaeota archaeon]|nr:hypothetical protein [Nanoarchaeota archaeon]